MSDEDAIGLPQAKEPLGPDNIDNVPPDGASLRRRQLQQWGQWGRRFLGGVCLLAFLNLVFLSQTEGGQRIVVEGMLDRALQCSARSRRPPAFFMVAHSIAKRVRVVAARAGVPIAPHDMRRTYAGLLAQRVSIYDVSKALRHSNVSVTEKYLEGRQDAAVAVSRAAGLDF